MLNLKFNVFISVLFSGIFFLSCSKPSENNPDDTPKFCGIDSMLGQTNPTASIYTMRYNYDSKGQMTRESNFTGNIAGFAFEYKYRADGKLASWTYLQSGVYKKLERTGVYDSQGKLTAMGVEEFPVNYGESDTLHFIYGSDALTTIRIVRGDTIAKTNFYNKGGNLSHSEYFQNGILTYTDTLEYTGIPFTNRLNSDALLLTTSRFPSKNFPSKQVTWDKVQGKKVLDDTITYEQDSKGRVTKVTTTSNLPVTPAYPVRWEQYYYGCD
ncbi:hypothetical protein [Pollutibacter soli]|uniref:hypothetical protein n=1 Tax=Pollutibacter soli TaxID=3034157 RepID=UPI003013D2D2